jgi:hypothetical protein
MFEKDLPFRRILLRARSSRTGITHFNPAPIAPLGEKIDTHLRLTGEGPLLVDSIAAELA